MTRLETHGGPQHFMSQASSLERTRDDMTRYTYGRAWNTKKWRLGQAMSESDGRKRYANGSDEEWFTVAAFGQDVPDDGIPEYTMEIVPGGRYFQVTFYDQSHSIRFIYGLRKEGDQLFHEDVVRYSYPDDKTRYEQFQAAIVESLRYEPDGVVHQRIDDKSKPVVENNTYRDVDVSSHWERIPEFGDWESVARFDR